MLVPMDERPVRDALGNATPKKKDRRATPPAAGGEPPALPADAPT